MAEQTLDYSLVPSEENVYTPTDFGIVNKSNEGMYDLSEGVDLDPTEFQNLFNTYADQSEGNVIYPIVPEEFQLKELDIGQLLKEGNTESDIAFNLVRRAQEKGILPSFRSADQIYEDALAEGVTDSELISHFTGIEDVSRTQAVLEGTTKGLGVSIPATYAGAKAFALTGGPLNPGLSIPAALTATIFAGAVADNVINNYLPKEYLPEDRPYFEGGKTVGFFAPSSVYARLIPMDKIDDIMAASSKILNNIKSSNLFKRMYEKSKGKLLEYMGGGLKLTKETKPLTEATAIASAGLAGGISEKVAPENILARLPSEIVGYALNPVGVISANFPIITTVIRKVKDRFSEEGRTSSAVKTLDKIIDTIQKKGFDTETDFDLVAQDLIKELSGDLKQFPLTAAEKQSFVALSEGRQPSLSLQAIQQQMIKEDPSQTGVLIAQQQTKNLEGLQNLLNLLIADGDPELISVAARLREEYFSNLLEGQIGLKANKAVELANKIAKVDGEEVTETAASKASEGIFDLLDDSLKSARKVERSLYNQIDRKVTLNATPLIKAYKALLDDDDALYLRDEVIPNFLRQRIGEMTEFRSTAPRAGLDKQGLDLFELGVGPKGSPTIELNQLLSLRSALRKKAQSLYADPKTRSAGRILGNLDEAILDTIGISLSSGKPVANMTPQNTQALRTAHSYSKALNDTYTRTFAGQVIRKSPIGQDVITPELAYLKMRGDKIGDVFKVDQVEEAVTFLLNKNYPGIVDNKVIQDNLTTLRGNQNIILRQFLDEKVVKKQEITNRQGQKESIYIVDGDRLRKSIGTTQRPTAFGEMIQKNFPELYSDLLDADKAATVYKNINNKNNIFNKQLKDVITFKNFVGKENPNKVISQMIGGTPGTNAVSPNAERNIKRIARFVSSPNAKPGTKEGYITSLIDYAMRNSTNTKGVVDFEKLNTFLYQPLSKKQPSIMQILRSEDLNVKNAAGETVPFITQDTFNNFKQLITLGRTLQNFKGTTEQAQLLEESIKKNTEGMFILNKLTRVFGARTGANVFRFFGMGGTLQAPSIGADIAVRQFEKYFPSLFARNIFVKAVTDPQVMADLLSSSVVNNKYTGKNLLKLLNAAGIEYGEGISEEISRPSYEPPREELRAVPQNVTQAPIAPQQVAMATPPPPAPKPDMASRARFQQLFPMDIASQTMTQTAPPMQSGIGSLV